MYCFARSHTGTGRVLDGSCGDRCRGPDDPPRRRRRRSETPHRHARPS